MNPEKLALKIRRRNPWEAVDLGVRLAQSSWRSYLPAWCYGFVPILVLAAAVSIIDFAWAGFAIWWAKPWLDRCLLYVYSRAVFGEHTTFRQMRLAIPGLFRRSGLLAGLTLYRLDPWRSFNLPVWQLEGLRGKARWHRASVLKDRAGGRAALLTLSCVHFEVVLTFAAVGLLLILMPESDIEYGLSLAAEAEAGVFGYLLYVLILSVIEPIYVASGFTLYLNRRNDLEAWDVATRFSQIARRVTAVTAMLIVTSSLLAQPLSVNPDDVRAQLDDVYQLEELQDTQWEDRWVPRKRRSGDLELPDDGIADAIEPFAELIAMAFRIGIWAIVIGLLVWLFLRFNPALRQGGKAPAKQRVTEIAGMDIRRSSLPDDIAAAARAAWSGGQAREALSLLYRGALAHLIELHALEIRRSDTEQDCLRRLDDTVPNARRQYLSTLTDAWTLLAYAHCTPDDQRAHRLIERFDVTFSTPGAPECNAG